MRAEVEAKIAAVADESTPAELRRFGTELIQSLDTRDPDPDAPPPVQVNELRITPLPGGGGLINGRFEDPVRFTTILAVLDAKSAPLTADDQRSAAERQADALADVCGYVAEHGDSEVLPSSGGYRPQVYLTVGLSNLEDRADAGCLAFGGTPTPGELRRLCCDSGVIPVVMNGASQPLDIGRNQRAIPSGLRAAVTVRDGGCAHPGCDRPPPWSEIHHIKEWSRGGETKLSNSGDVVQGPPPRNPLDRLVDPDEARRDPGVHPSRSGSTLPESRAAMPGWRGSAMTPPERPCSIRGRPPRRSRRRPLNQKAPVSHRSTRPL